MLHKHIHESTICRYLYLGIAQGHVFSMTVYDVFTLNPLDVGCYKKKMWYDCQ